jgi:hypothetical protein
LKEKLDVCLKNGSLNPRDYMYFLQFEKSTGKEQSGFFRYYQFNQKGIDFSCYNLCFNMGWGKDCIDNNYANKCRRNIGVCSFETDKKKADINQKYNFEFLNISL